MPGISHLLDSDMEDDVHHLDENSMLSSVSDVNEAATTKTKAASQKRPTKRHRVTMPKPKSKVAKTSPAPMGKKISQKAAHAKQMYIEEQMEDSAIEGTGSATELGQSEAVVKPRAKGRPTSKSKALKPSSAIDADAEPASLEIEETSTATRSNHAQSKPTRMGVNPTRLTKNAAKKKTLLQSAVETQDSVPMDIDSAEDELETVVLKQPARPRGASQSRPESSFQRRAGSASDTERGDPVLRRRLGDITRKFENIDTKYRNLKDVGITEANANFERIRRQCEATSEASNDLIASLKKELALQTPLAMESRKLQKDLRVTTEESRSLTSANAELRASLQAAQNEIKSLQAKLAAARQTSLAEPVATKTPGSAMKNSALTKTTTTSSAENVQTTQMKLDLYGDLTGLIIRGVKRAEDGDTFDCIQTGRNGTLHFKLFIDHEDARTATFEETEFLYTPLLDENRDRDLIDMMPQYLTEDITFARQNAAKFYQRVVDTLTKKVTEV